MTLTDENLKAHLESLQEEETTRSLELRGDRWRDRPPNPTGDDDNASVVSGLSAATAKSSASDDAHMSAALSHINENLDREHLLRKAVSGRNQAKKTKHGPVREWLLRVNRGKQRVWEMSQFPDLRYKLSYGATYRDDMTRNEISYECFWKCDLVVRGGVYIKYRTSQIWNVPLNMCYTACQHW